MGGRRIGVAGLALLFGCAVPALAAAQVLRAPYLQRLTPTSVVVMWQTDLTIGTDSLVHYGTSAGTLDLSATGTAVDSPTDAGLRNHAVAITGLMPNTTYYYDVATSSAGVCGGGTADFFFTTPPLLGTALAFDAWVLGDSGTGGAQQLAVRDAMLGLGITPRLFLHVGDIAYTTGTNAQFTSRVFSPYAAILRHTPLFPAIGNHEASEGSSDSATGTGPYYEAFTLPSAGQGGGVASNTEAYYAFDYANAHFIALDSDDSSTAQGSAQLQWLAADLGSVPASQQWIIVWFHHPPYTKGSHNSDLASDSGGRMQRMRENVAPILEAAGVDLVLSGHSHAYERSYLISGAYGYGTSPSFATPSFATLVTDGHVLESGDGRATGDGAYRKGPGRAPYDGTLYVVTGHGGNTLSGPIDHPVMRFSELQYGSLLLTIDGTGLRLRNVRSNGTIADDVWLHKPPLQCTTSAECSDLRACTDDVCDSGTCHSTARACPMGQACSESAGGCACVPGACDDVDVCTTDACDALTGCVYTTVDCADTDACTSDSCAPATGCQHAAITCDDGLVCTDDACDPVSGCVTSFNTAACDDGVSCTASDHCTSGTCAGTELDCAGLDDACNAGACEPATGTCGAQPVADGTVCSLGDCRAGVCVAIDAGQPPPVAGAGADEDAGAFSPGDAGAAVVPDAAVSADASMPVPRDAGSSGAPSSEPDSGPGVSPRDAASAADGGAGGSGTSAFMPRLSSDCGCRLARPQRLSGARWAWVAFALGVVGVARLRRRRA